MKYELPFSAVIVVDAPNVVKARDAASKLRLIGRVTGFASTAKGSQWAYSVEIKSQKIGLPRKVK